MKIDWYELLGNLIFSIAITLQIYEIIKWVNKKEK